MLYGIALSGTGGQIERARLENVSNNLANVETPGFKEELLTVMQRPAESRTFFEGHQLERLNYAQDMVDKIGGGVWLHQSYTNFEAGHPRYSGNQLDFALSNQGFFEVEEVTTGDTFYTRDGQFVQNDEGYLTTRDGDFYVLDDRGNRINMREMIESNGGVGVNVGTDGNIQVELAGGGAIDTGTYLSVPIFEKDDLHALEKYQKNLFVPMVEDVVDRSRQLRDLNPEERSIAGRVLHKYVESSGTTPVNLMKEMIDVNRAFERNMEMMTVQNRSLEALIGQVARA